MYVFSFDCEALYNCRYKWLGTFLRWSGAAYELLSQYLFYDEYANWYKCLKRPNTALCSAYDRSKQEVSYFWYFYYLLQLTENLAISHISLYKTIEISTSTDTCSRHNSWPACDDKHVLCALGLKPEFRSYGACTGVPNSLLVERSCKQNLFCFEVGRCIRELA